MAAAEPDFNDATLIAPDRRSIPLYVWEPQGPARGVVQILHGLGEHAGRYARFAGAASARGYRVVAHDHRGHGPGARRRGHFAPAKGWALLEIDALCVRDHIASLDPDLPVVLLGHSMGSYLAQYFAMHYGSRFNGLVLSGSGWPQRLRIAPGFALAWLLRLAGGRTRNSPLLTGLGFDSMNRRFEPGRTDMDWLSRDEAEVDEYIADPLCGGPYTAGLWFDFLGGLLAVSSDTALARIPAEMPILVTGGSNDPVGGEAGMGELMLRLAQTGHSRLTLKLYPEGRHEMLNEINRDEVTRDWLDWIDRVTQR